MLNFEEYFKQRQSKRPLVEMDEKKSEPAKPGGVTTNITLGKDNDFQPFVVTDDPRNPAYPSYPNLAPVIRAFQDSNKVAVYNSMGNDGSAKPHKLGSKKLFLVGGPVRDHLKGKTPKDLDLATDATPDEIRMILLDAGFVETDAVDAPAKDARSSSKNGSKIFYVKGKDKGSNQDFVFGVKVNGEEFDLATFRKDSKESDGRRPNSMQFAGHKDDADRRDLTINSMYISLTNPDGPNNTLTDFHGGVRDIMHGDVRFVGNPEDRLNEDLLRALRYVRFLARYGNGKPNQDAKEAIAKVLPKMLDRKVLSPERIQDEFSKGLSSKDVDPAVYIKLYKELGLIDIVFPGVKINTTSLPQDRDKSVVTAMLLRDNKPEVVLNALKDAHWSTQDTNRVVFLIKMLNFHPHVSPEELDQYLRQYQSSGINPKSLKSFWGSQKPDQGGVIDSFVNFVGSPRVSTMQNDEFGNPRVRSEFEDLFDTDGANRFRPRSGIDPSGVPYRNLIGQRQREMEHQNWLKHKSG